MSNLKPTWTTNGNVTFCDIGQGVTIGASTEGGNAFVQVSYRGEATQDAVNVDLEELQKVASKFGEEFFLGLAKACRKAAK